MTKTFSYVRLNSEGSDLVLRCSAEVFCPNNWIFMIFISLAFLQEKK